jgi:hypothetical protein
MLGWLQKYRCSRVVLCHLEALKSRRLVRKLLPFRAQEDVLVVK